jgi:putative Mg2+ transporter-C (MgtC) family protein
MPVRGAGQVNDYVEIALRLAAALLAGGIIGAERSYHGRPAGFRTYGLVCMSSSLLMLAFVYEYRWLTPPRDVPDMDAASRVLQSIMTGIGFLGAGTIIKEGFTVRGLTTAAAIWATAALGALIGLGFHYPAAVTVVLTLAALTVFQWIENLLPEHVATHAAVRFARDAAPAEAEMRRLLYSHGFAVRNINYRVSAKDGFFEYRLMLRAANGDARALVDAFSRLEGVKEIRLTVAEY